MPVPSPDALSWVLGEGALFLALWASCRIGLRLVANVVGDVREEIEGEQVQSGLAPRGEAGGVESFPMRGFEVSAGSGTGKPRAFPARRKQ